jgi:hypothetical protein
MASSAKSWRTRGCARFGGRDAFDFQHGPREQPHLVVRYFGRENLCKAAFHLVHAGRVGFAKAEELSVATADDGQKFLLLRVTRFAHEDDHLLPVERFGRWFGRIEFFIGLGKFGPGFKRHDGNGGGMGDAQETGGGGEVVFLVGVRQRSRDEHERPVSANQEKSGRHFPAVAHAKLGVLLGIGQQVIQRFRFSLRLHRQYNDANGAKEQESVQPRR